MVAKMKKGTCYVLVTGTLFCLLYLAPPSSWPLPGGTGQGGTEAPAEGGAGGGDPSVPFNFPHPAETLLESLPFRFFEEEEMYQVEGEGDVQRQISLHEHALLTQAKEAAASLLTQAHPDHDTTFNSGRYRWLPDGVEYDLLYKDQVSEAATRVTLFQKLNNAQHVRTIDVDPKKVVHVILALQGRLDKYEIFLQHFTSAVLPSDPKLSLTVVYFSDEHMTQAEDMTAKHFSAYPAFKWSFVPLEEKAGKAAFSRGRGLHVGALRATVDPDELLFFSDVDVLMKPQFLERCRANTVYGHQVYYPVVFSLYNPGLVYPLLEQAVPPVEQQLMVGPNTGFWRTFGYGMACVARGDYLLAGGFPHLKTWGGEDEDLYQHFLTLDQLKVIRAPEPGLFHLYHNKECGQTEGPAYVACLKSKALTEGSKTQLGLTLLKVHKGTDLEGVLSKRFYYFWLVPYLGMLLSVSVLTNLLQAALLFTGRRPQAYKVV